MADRKRRTRGGVEGLLLADARVDDIHDAVQRDARLRDVGGHDAAPAAGRGGRKDAGLQLQRQRCVERQHKQISSGGLRAAGHLHITAP